MTQEEYLGDAVGRLRGALPGARRHAFASQEFDSRDEVLARFGPVFSPERISQLEEQEVKAFLLFENNKHWTGLHRQGNRICADMVVLRHALDQLLDEKLPLATRLDSAVDAVYGLGKATATAMLLMAHPDKYGVWNNVSEGALKELGVWPRFDRGDSLGQQYECVNRVLNRLAEGVGIDLWTLDALLWVLVRAPEDLPPDGGEGPVRVLPRGGQAFGLERHLHDFLRDNWEQTELGREYTLYEQDGEEVGYEYPTNVGRIDLLARHRSKPEWLVIELKRGETSDTAVGQVLRYVGWVRRNLAEEGQAVRGLIIAGNADDGLLHAVDAVRFIDLRLYEVDFRLRPAPSLDGKGPEASS